MCLPWIILKVHTCNIWNHSKVMSIPAWLKNKEKCIANRIPINPARFPGSSRMRKTITIRILRIKNTKHFWQICGQKKKFIAILFQTNCLRILITLIIHFGFIIHIETFIVSYVNQVLESILCKILHDMTLCDCFADTVHTMNEILSDNLNPRLTYLYP